MKYARTISRVGLEGAFMVLSPLPFLLPFPEVISWGYYWQLGLASVASVACLMAAFWFFRRPLVGKCFAIIAAVACYASAWFFILDNPFVALLATVLLTGGFFSLFEDRIDVESAVVNPTVGHCGQKAWWGTLMVPLVLAVYLFVQRPEADFAVAAILTALSIAVVLYVRWAAQIKSIVRTLFSVIGFLLVFLLYFLHGFAGIPSLVLLFVCGMLLSFPTKKDSTDRPEYWWEILLNHPARILLTTFLGLCFIGVFLLSLPVSTPGGSIDLVDAFFTSVSAVCVTGLIVLDTPNAFTGFGQFCILLLIQLGGLGIMSITTVALHAMGRRLSLKQERLLSSMTNTGHVDLLHSLKTILKFTFVAEGTGALLLFFFFRAEGGTVAMAAWRGIFTAVSAFCNAGFALQSDSVIPYQTNTYILYTVSTLIIFGGMAPATSLLIPRWLAGKSMPIPARIVLTSTVILLLSGTLLIMAFEWNGVLSEFSLADKIHNAWFQSVTLRTAGFNSVEIATISSPTFMIMLAFMFIGGSPGGTAGGVKTTTIGILAMTFWANITNKDDVVMQNRRIHSSTVYRSITIVFSGMIVWFTVVLMLQATQQVSSRDLIFEATSAIGTVGLSTGATPFLDEIGKVIIILAMFVGRIGPMTLFMFLSEEQSVSASRCPEEKISLT